MRTFRRLIQTSLLFASLLPLTGCLSSETPLFENDYQYAEELFPDKVALFFTHRYGILRKKRNIDRPVYETKEYDDIIFLEQTGQDSKKYVLAQFKDRSSGIYYYLYFQRVPANDGNAEVDDTPPAFKVLWLNVEQISEAAGLGKPTKENGYYNIKSLGPLSKLPLLPISLGNLGAEVYVLDLDVEGASSKYSEMVAATKNCGQPKCPSAKKRHDKKEDVQKPSVSAKSDTTEKAKRYDNLGNRKISKNDLSAIQKFIDDEIRRTKTNLFMCTYLKCKEVEKDKYIFSYDSQEWFYADGKIYDSD
ncbi:hypothetical protein [Zhengella mangrovi]|uniref:hypothetical protein n=1 Tax=Zhengella mangrovi TaxID=1982044 RepID=UPI001054D732|nr:hypothetical protein [Zhengella mangrovi]